LPELQKAIALDPSYAQAHYQAGRLLVRLGQYKEARDELEKAIALQPEFPEAYYQLGQVEIRLGEKEKGQQALAKFQKFRAAEFSERQGLLKQARQIIQGEP
jgi:predicted Zn-dependent protease